MYKITIEKILPPPEGKNYSSDEVIYSQLLEDLDLPAVISVINKINK